MDTVTTKLLKHIDLYIKGFPLSKTEEELIDNIKETILELIPYETRLYKSIFDDAQDTYQNDNGEWLFSVENFPEYLRSRFEIYKTEEAPFSFSQININENPFDKKYENT